MKTLNLADLLRKIELGDRPSRTVVASLAIALQDLGVDEVRRLPEKALFQAGQHNESIRAVLEHIDADEFWCCYHNRWEPKSSRTLRSRGACDEGQRAYARDMYARRTT